MNEPRQLTFDFQEYYDWLESTSWYAGAGEEDTQEITYLTLGLAGESGEAADVIKKLHRKHGYNAWEYAEPAEIMKFVLEVGDVLWYVTRLTRALDIRLEELVLMNITKLYTRMNTRDEHGLKAIDWPLKQITPEEAVALCTKIEAKLTHQRGAPQPAQH